MEDLLRDAPAVRVISRISPQSLAGEIQSLIADRSLPSAAEIRESALGYSWSNVADAIIKEYQVAMDLNAMESDSPASAEASG
jgi:hypothetical protein